MLESILSQLGFRYKLAASSLHQWWQRRSHKSWEMICENWHLGFTAFGGPPVHFKIFNEKFVRKAKWIDETMYQELFGVAQALSGPGSTKMLYCINLIHGGTFNAILGLFLWSMPAALVMYGFSVGVSNFGDKLPAPVYALMSGLNAAIVGVIALAAVELSQKAITDNLTRVLILITATAGLLYNALWYFPVLLVICSCIALIYDYRLLHRPMGYVFRIRRTESTEESILHGPTDSSNNRPSTTQSSGLSSTTTPATGEPSTSTVQDPEATTESEQRIIPRELQLNISWKAGAVLIGFFLSSFVAVMITRGVLKVRPLLFSLFANMFLAGTIIFGGGPVVVPLLREYVVAEGWVNQQDFLIGLALIQALPGPNFNLAVYLGSLTALNGGFSSVLGAVVAWIGIFFPGLILVHGTMGIWSSIRNRRWVKSVLRGTNAGAIGLIYTAVYRIWQSGFIDQNFQSGRSLGDDPWWLVVATLSYCFGSWYKVQAPLVIIGGAVSGLLRYAVVRS